MTNIREVVAADYADWDCFVAQHPSGGVFQLSSMIRIYESVPSLLPIALAAYDDCGRIMGGVVGCIFTEKEGLLAPLARRAIIMGGALLSPTDPGVTLAALMCAFERASLRRPLYSEVWLLAERSAPDIWSALGYTWIPHLNFMIDLSAGRDVLWDGLSASRRKDIRRSERQGVLIDVASTWAEHREFHRLVCDNYRRLGLPAPSVTLFRGAYDILVPQGLACCYVARHKGRMVGGRMVLCYKDLVYDWYAGSASGLRGLYPDEALVWRVLRDHIEAGYRWFNFGGAGHPDVEYGPREFKRRFGGQLVNHGRLRKVHAPARTWLVENGFRYYQTLSALCGRKRARQVSDPMQAEEGDES